MGGVRTENVERQDVRFGRHFSRWKWRGWKKVFG